MTKGMDTVKIRNQGETRVRIETSLEKDTPVVIHQETGTIEGEMTENPVGKRTKKGRVIEKIETETGKGVEEVGDWSFVHQCAIAI